MCKRSKVKSTRVATQGLEKLLCMCWSHFHDKAIQRLASQSSHNRLSIDGISGLHMLLISAWALTISGRN